VSLPDWQLGAQEPGGDDAIILVTALLDAKKDIDGRDASSLRDFDNTHDIQIDPHTPPPIPTKADQEMETSSATESRRDILNAVSRNLQLSRIASPTDTRPSQYRAYNSKDHQLGGNANLAPLKNVPAAAARAVLATLISHLKLTPHRANIPNETS